MPRWRAVLPGPRDGRHVVPVPEQLDESRSRGGRQVLRAPLGRTVPGRPVLHLRSVKQLDGLPVLFGLRARRSAGHLRREAHAGHLSSRTFGNGRRDDRPIQMRLQP